MMIGWSINLGFDLFPHPVGHFGFIRQWGVPEDAALLAVSEGTRRQYAVFLKHGHTNINHVWRHHTMVS